MGALRVGKHALGKPWRALKGLGEAVNVNNVDSDANNHLSSVAQVTRGDSEWTPAIVAQVATFFAICGSLRAGSHSVKALDEIGKCADRGIVFDSWALGKISARVDEYGVTGAAAKVQIASIGDDIAYDVATR